MWRSGLGFKVSTQNHWHPTQDSRQRSTTSFNTTAPKQHSDKARMTLQRVGMEEAEQ